MDLKKELLEFVEANNWFSLEGRKNAEGVIDSYLKSYNKQLTLTDVVVPKGTLCDHEFKNNGMGADVCIKCEVVGTVNC